MKANEAPEKIYMTPSFGEPDNVLLASFSKSHLNYHIDIEYTRTDAFMEKAEKFFEENIEEEECKIGCSEWTELRSDYKSLDSFIRAFRRYMKGE